MANLKNYHTPLFVISIAIISFQLCLVQLLSYVQWHHFAFMIISIAMLGFGAAGTVLSIFSRFFLANSQWSLFIFSALCALLLCMAIPLSQLPVFRFDSFLIFSDFNHILRFTGTCFIFFLPFFFGALVIGLIFYVQAEHVGVIYFANLAGSAAGGMIIPVLMWWVAPESLPYLVAILPLIAAFFLIPDHSGSYARMVMFITAITVVVSFVFKPELKMSEYKDLAKAKLLPGAQLHHERFSPYGMFHILQSPVMRHGHGVGLHFEGEIPVQPMYFINGNWIGAQLTQPDSGVHLLDFAPIAFPFQVGGIHSALMLQGNTFTEADYASYKGTAHIVATEPNPQIRDLYIENCEKKSVSTQVEIMPIEPRTYLEAYDRQFDLVSLPSLGSFGGNAGIHALEEDYLYTLEGFQSIWSHLTRDGWMKITVWNDYPPQYALRLALMLRQFMEMETEDVVNQHLLILKSWGSYTFFIHKSRLTNDIRQTFEDFCTAKGFEVFKYDPDVNIDYATIGEQTDQGVFDQFLNAALFHDPWLIMQAYAFRMEPPTDNSPFIHQFLKKASLQKLRNTYSTTSVPYFGLGYLMVWITIGVVVALALAFIVLPILIRKQQLRNDKTWIILYFGSIGLGYLFIEINLIQQCILYFGNPVYAVAATISTILLFSGLGSFVSEKWEGAWSKLPWIIIGVVFLAIINGLMFNGFTLSTVNYGLAIKLLLFVLMIGPIAFLMGFPFPLAISYLSKKHQQAIPWAWGVNGYFSVISSPLAIILAVEWGYQVLWLLAAALYVLPLIARFSIQK